MRPRGFTLVELLVAGAITTFVIALVLGTFVSQQRSFAALDLSRQAQETARDAMLEMEQPLRRLGFGLEPRYALDFSIYACTATPCVRDRADGPDELVFLARDPAYRWLDNGEGACTTPGGCFTGHAWPITSTSPFQVTARKGDKFHKGRVMLAACPAGRNMTMGTLEALSQAAADGTITLSVAPAVAGNPYRENIYASCLTEPGAAVFFVDRYRYFVRDVAGTPWLMLDTGLDLNEDGITPDAGDVADLLPIAPNVADLQIAYLLDPGTTLGFAAPDSGADWIIGNASGTREQPNPAVTPVPIYSTPRTDAARFTLHPANVRGLRLTYGVRASRSDAAGPTTVRPLRLSENRNTLPGVLGYSFSSTVTTRDMLSRSPSIF